MSSHLENDNLASNPTNNNSSATATATATSTASTAPGGPPHSDSTPSSSASAPSANTTTTSVSSASSTHSCATKKRTLNQLLNHTKKIKMVPNSSHGHQPAKQKTGNNTDDLNIHLSNQQSSSSSITNSFPIEKRFRSRSVPYIPYQTFSQCESNKASMSRFSGVSVQDITSSILLTNPLPPVNLSSLREIDLQEILKNPQLRHDIIFDPQLQFRPNVEGDRGKRKKLHIDKYWASIERELTLYFESHLNFNLAISKLPTLFITLRDILLSLMPQQDKQKIIDVMDIELLIQNLKNGTLQLCPMFQWLGSVLKKNCAPTRDSIVDNMLSCFERDADVKSIIKGLGYSFQILERMKLDVANHQIRIMKPLLISTAIDFEKDYFNQMIKRDKISIQDSLGWYSKAYHKLAGTTKSENLHQYTIIHSIIDLLSCRNMVNEFPSTLSFDNSKLIVLRADIRQLACLQLCILLYKQLVLRFDENLSYRAELLSFDNLNDLKKRVLAIVVDENGNSKWTKNINDLALTIVQRCTVNPKTSDGQIGKAQTTLPSNDMVAFAFNWLIKQTQPNSRMYGILEDRIFSSLKSLVLSSFEKDENLLTSEEFIRLTSESSSNTSLLQSSFSSSAPLSSAAYLSQPSEKKANDRNTDVTFQELSTLGNALTILIKFHWNVLGGCYLQCIN
ncbi:BA75_02682T0 [Komagataella pastoris]|uniref:BA75_02682T0 n=1 Tax=Komagataella pastoris TaxID=4922 RepID=A0A1B2JB98_PICPA|nr:BA75_02682T0 [Komagataella pastoris]